MNDWIFQCNPKRYDVHVAVAQSLDEWWNTPLQRSQITVGIGCGWRLSARTIPASTMSPRSPVLHCTTTDTEFGRWRSDLHFDYRLEPFLSRAELLDDPVLGAISAFRGFQGSNRLIPPEAGQRVLELATDRLQPLGAGQPSPVAGPDLDVGRAIERHTLDVRARLKDAIRTLSPLEFELLVVRVLAELDFEVEHVGHAGDGGVDAEAVLSLRGLTSVRTKVQARRWGNTVGSRVVRELRGALRIDERGLIITTSDFSPDARTEAHADGKARIGVLIGDELVTLCLERGIGVSQRRVILYELDPDGLNLEAVDAVS